MSEQPDTAEFTDDEQAALINLLTPTPSRAIRISFEANGSVRSESDWPELSNAEIALLVKLELSKLIRGALGQGLPFTRDLTLNVQVTVDDGDPEPLAA